jgi:hypothetical protein
LNTATAHSLVIRFVVGGGDDPGPVLDGQARDLPGVDRVVDGAGGAGPQGLRGQPVLAIAAMEVAPACRRRGPAPGRAW